MFYHILLDPTPFHVHVLPPSIQPDGLIETPSFLRSASFIDWLNCSSFQFIIEVISALGTVIYLNLDMVG